MRAIHFLAVLALAVLGFSACKKQFDAPPVGEYPALTPTMSIEQLKISFSPATGPMPIDSGTVIEGIVVGDDKTGNFYKNLVIQDSTGGIQIRINATNLYNQFPRNRKVWLRCDGLFLGDYNGTPQITAAGGAGIEDAMIRNYLVPGPLNQVVEPEVVTIQTLTARHINTLVKLENVEFASADANKFYADPVGKLTVNRTIRDCNGGSILLRTSGYSTIAGALTPNAKGSITAVYAVFGSDKQLYIRDTTDVNMTETRCSGGGGSNSITIAALRDIFNNGGQVIPAGTRIRAFVVSDRANGNFDGRNLVLQDATAGITIRFTSNHNFDLGQEVDFDLSEGTLSEFSGLLQVQNIPSGNGDVLSSGNSFTPPTFTISQIVSNLSGTRTLESTLVRIENATIASSTSLNGSRTVSDGSGATIALFTRSQASFSGNPVPSGTVEIVAVVSVFNSPQISIRSMADITGGGPAPTPDLTSIADIRGQFSGTATTVSGARRIRGVVTSDRTTASVVGQNMFVQDGTAGVVVRFTANHSFNLGDSVEVVVTGAALEEFQGLLQVSGLPTSSCTAFSTGHTPAVIDLTIADLLANFETYEARLVRIVSVTISGGTTFGANFGNLTATDPSGNMALFTRTASNFASTTVPTGARTVTALVSQGGTNSTRQLVLRSASDVQ